MPKGIMQIPQPPNHPNITPQDVTKGQKIYEGDYCDVIQVVKGDHVYAVKAIYKQRINPPSFQNQINQIGNQISILYSCNHPIIIPLLAHFQTSEMIALVFPKFGSTLRKFIISKKKKQGNPFTMEIFIKLFRQIGEGIKQIHTLGYVHRDISSDNILVNKNYEIKIIDFGYANSIWGRKTKTGTRQYLAPEILENQRYNHKIDIWSLGILCYQILYGTFLFKPKGKNLSDDQIQKQYRKNMMNPVQQYPDDKLLLVQKPPLEMLSTIKCFLNFNPDKRPEIGFILSKKVFGAENSQTKDQQAEQMLRSKTQRKSTKTLGNLKADTKSMSVSQLQGMLFSLVAAHSNQMERQKQLLSQVLLAQVKLTDIRIQKYSKKCMLYLKQKLHIIQ